MFAIVEDGNINAGMRASSAEKCDKYPNKKDNEVKPEDDCSWHDREDVTKDGFDGMGIFCSKTDCYMEFMVLLVNILVEVLGVQ